MDDWRRMSACDLGRGIAAGRIDPADLVECFLDAIAADPESARTYVRVTAERARAEAQEARVRATGGLRRGLLDGVPISWKDLFDTADIPTEAGSALLKGRVPARDAAVLRAATEAGLVCIGKTHMTELAFSGLGLNPVTESPPCINDPEAVAGGSSSGAATSVAFGLAAAGIGSDTGGSVRVPSVWNDLVGLKTTAGRLPLEGVVPLCARFDTVGPLCRSVEDAVALLAAMEGGHAADLRGARLEGARFLVLDGVAFDKIEEAPRHGFEAAVDRLGGSGAVISRAGSPSVEEAMGLSGVLFATEAYGTWSEKIEANPDVMFPPVRERFRGGKAFSGADFVAAWHRLDALRAAFRAETAGYDAVLVPTCPILPPKQERLLADTEYFTERNLMALRNTRIGNLMGLSVLTLPTGVPSAGISLMGHAMGEERLLRIGAAAEAVLT